MFMFLEVFKLKYRHATQHFAQPVGWLGVDVHRPTASQSSLDQINFSKDFYASTNLKITNYYYINYGAYQCAE